MNHDTLFIPPEMFNRTPAVEAAGPNNLATKLAEIGREVAYIQKDGQIAFGSENGRKAKYASAEKVLGKINEAVFGRGIALGTEIVDVQVVSLRDGKDRPYNLATVRLRIAFIDSETGEVLTCEGVGSGADSSDKAVMKAFTAAHKYAYAGAFCISWGDDPEATVAVEDETPAAPKTNGKKAAPETNTTVVGTLLARSVASLTKEMEAVCSTVRALPPDEYARVVEGFKTRLVALQPKDKKSEEYAAYRAAVKLFKEKIRGDKKEEE